MRGIMQVRLLMKGKTVVITGGTSGIGEVAAEALAQMGARIVLVARNKSPVWLLKSLTGSRLSTF